MKPKLKATLQDIQIEAKYRGTVYDQTALLETEQGTVEVYDDHNVVDEKTVDEAASFIILVNPSESDFEKVKKDKKGIAETNDPISKWSHTFYGKIVSTKIEDRWFREKHERLLLLDIGIGTVLLSLTDKIEKLLKDGDLKVGDSVCVSAARTDLVDTSN